MWRWASALSCILKIDHTQQQFFKIFIYLEYIRMRPTAQYQYPPPGGITSISEGTAPIWYDETWSSNPPTNMISGVVNLSDGASTNQPSQLQSGNGFAGGQMQLSLGCLDVNDLKWNNPGLFQISAMTPKTFIPVWGAQRGDSFGLASSPLYPTHTKLLPEASVWFPQLNTSISIK